MPDVVVGEHIDRDCKSDPAQRKRKVGTWCSPSLLSPTGSLLEPGGGMETAHNSAVPGVISVCSG